ncbi:MAG: hypothetical protein IJ833_07600 [Lachnospiraceae bacterium]|nr:hypothetical protein [Lachnospiraceae bacterium]
MTIDHIGLVLLDNYIPFRYAGRLAFPLFGYMLAEGCYYTRNKRRHFAGILLLGLLCQAVYLVVEHSIYQGILITFCLSILTIYAIIWARDRQGQWWRWLLPVAMLGLDLFLCKGLPMLLPGTDYAMDYGIWGVLFPVLVSLSRNRRIKWCLAAAGLVFLSISMGNWQWYSLLALIPIWFYNGQKGVWNTKYLFYIYYPVHLIIIYGISLAFTA